MGKQWKCDRCGRGWSNKWEREYHEEDCDCCEESNG